MPETQEVSAAGGVEMRGRVGEKEETGRNLSFPLSGSYSLISNSGFLNRALQNIGGLGETQPGLCLVSLSPQTGYSLNGTGRPALCSVPLWGGCEHGLENVPRADTAKGRREHQEKVSYPLWPSAALSVRCGSHYLARLRPKPTRQSFEVSSSTSGDP